MNTQIPDALPIIQKKRSYTMQDKTKQQKIKDENMSKDENMQPWKIINRVDAALQLLKKADNQISSTQALLQQTQKSVSKSIFNMDRYIDYKYAGLSDEEYKKMLEQRKQKKSLTVNLPLQNNSEQEKKLIKEKLSQNSFNIKSFYDRNYYQFLEKQKNKEFNTQYVLKRRPAPMPVQPKVMFYKSKDINHGIVRVDMEKLRKQQNEHAFRIQKSRNQSRSLQKHSRQISQPAPQIIIN